MMAAIWLSLVLILAPLSCQAKAHDKITGQSIEDGYQDGGFASMAPNHPATVSVRLATVTSPGYPGNYPANLSKVLLSIGVPWYETEGFVSLHFTRFDLEMCLFCTCDYLRIDALHMSLCGDSLPPYYTNNTIIIPREKILNNLITLEFSSNARKERSGFAIEYEQHTHRPVYTYHANSNTAATSPHPVSRCPVAQCPTCRRTEGHATMTVNNCPKCVCVVTPPPTLTPLSSACPVANCPTCLPGMRYRMVTVNNCPKCVCVVTPPPTLTPLSTACPVANCPTCLPGMGYRMVTVNSCPKCVCVVTHSRPSTPLSTACPVANCPRCSSGMGHHMVYTSGCPQCVCVPVFASTTPSASGDSRLQQLLQGIARHAKTIESETRHLEDEVQQAASILQHR